MQLPTEIFGNVAVVHTLDELGADQAEPFKATLLELEKPQVVLDIDHAELLDSAGLSAVLDVQDAMRERGGDLKIATTNATNRKILEVTRLDQQLEVFESVLDAVRSFR